MSSLDSRYGRTPTRSRWSPSSAPSGVPGWVLVAVVVAVVGVAWLAWAAWGASRDPVRAQLTAFDVVSPSSVEVRIEVYRRGGEAVRCEVYAQAYDHGIVGEDSVDLAAGAPGTTVVTTSVTTERPAVAGMLRGCEVADGS